MINLIRVMQFNYKPLGYILCVKQVFQFCLKDMLGKEQRESLFYFLDALKSTLAESHKSEDVATVAIRLSTGLALMEQNFPGTYANIPYKFCCIHIYRTSQLSLSGWN